MGGWAQWVGAVGAVGVLTERIALIGGLVGMCVDDQLLHKLRVQAPDDVQKCKLTRGRADSPAQPRRQPPQTAPADSPSPTIWQCE